jgi:hypothetical protein
VVSELMSALDALTATDRHGMAEPLLLSPRDAAQRMWLARRPPFHPEVAEVLAGEISHDHAQVILGSTAQAL